MTRKHIPMAAPQLPSAVTESLEVSHDLGPILTGLKTMAVDTDKDSLGAVSFHRNASLLSSYGAWQKWTKFGRKYPLLVADDRPVLHDLLVH
jgi:hypothetical protein